MGSINYGTSEYITMGIKPESAYDYEKDPCTMEEMQELAEEWGMSVEDAIMQNIEDNAECDRMNTEAILNKYDFHYFNITIESGYYEGFYIDIEYNGYIFDHYTERKDALKEVREIESMLKELAGCGIVSVYPGWCTGYADYKQTLKDIREAAKGMRADIKKTPTWKTYKWDPITA